MKLSAWVSVGDLISQKKTLFEKFIIGKFIYQSIFYKKNPKQVLSFLKAVGVDGIELLATSNVTDYDLKRIDKMLKDVNMHVFSVHQSLSTLFNIKILEINNLCRIAKRLGAKVVVLHINVIGKRIFDNKYIGSLKELEKEYKIKITVENSPKSILTIFKPYCYQEEKFFKITKENDLSITFDITHLAQIGGDIISFYNNHKKQIANIHLSDYRKSLKNQVLLMASDTHLSLGKGELPIKDFLKTLKNDSYDGLITMEINGNLEELFSSARLVKSYF